MEGNKIVKNTWLNPKTSQIKDNLNTLNQPNYQFIAFALFEENQKLRMELAKAKQGNTINNKINVSQSISVNQKQDSESCPELLGEVGKKLGGKDGQFAGRIAGSIIEFYLETEKEKKIRVY